METPLSLWEAVGILRLVCFIVFCGCLFAAGRAYTDDSMMEHFPREMMWVYFKMISSKYTVFVSLLLAIIAVFVFMLTF